MRLFLAYLFVLVNSFSLVWSAMLVQMNKRALSRVKSSVEAHILLDGLVDIDGSFPRVPLLCRKLMNFLWIVDSVSHSANAQLGFNDLSLLFESMLLLHPRPILQICCVALCLQHATISLCSLFPPHRYGFCVSLPLASCRWWAAILIVYLLWNLPRPVLNQFYTGPHCEELNWGNSFYFVSFWLLSIHHSFCKKSSQSFLKLWPLLLPLKLMRMHTFSKLILIPLRRLSSFLFLQSTYAVKLIIIQVAD